MLTKEQRDEMTTEQKCAWTDDGEAWATGCGQLFCLNDGGPTENDMRFCCFCGKPLVEVLYDEAVEDGDSDER